MIEELRSEPLFIMRLQVAYPRAQMVGVAPLGERGIYPVEGGTFEGPRMRGRVLPDGADWVLWRSDGAMVIDVRTSLETDDGAVIAMEYQGLAYANSPESAERFRRREILPEGEVAIHTAARFQTGDPRYEWLNRVIAVTNGTRTPDGPMYHVFAIL